MSIINFSNTRQMEGILDEISQVKELIESKINLSRTVDREKRASLTTNKVMRICFIVGLSLITERKEEDYKDIQLSTTSARIVPSFFTMHDLSTLYSALLKLRYASLNIDWSQMPCYLASLPLKCCVVETTCWLITIWIPSYMQ